MTLNTNYLVGLAKLSVGESYNIPSYMAVGSTTGTLTADDLITSGEFDRVAITTSRSNTIGKYTGTISSASAADEIVRLMGLHNISTPNSSGYLQANFLLASIIHTTNFDLDLELWVNFEEI